MPSAAVLPEISTTVRTGNLQRRSLSALLRAFPRTTAPWLARQFLTPRGRQAPLDLRDATVESIAVRGNQIDIGLWGEGPLVLLVHGWAGGGVQFDLLRAELVGRGFRVACFDAPAHGASVASTTSLLDFMGVIEAVSECQGPIHALVGHSLGATAVALSSRNWPEGMAPALVLLAPMPGFRFALDSFARSLNLSDVGCAVLSDHLQRTLGFDAREMELGALRPKVPSLFVHDAQDKATPLSASRDLVSAWPGAALLETSGLGHSRILADSSVIERVCSFIQAQPLRRISALDRQLSVLGRLHFV